MPLMSNIDRLHERYRTGRFWPIAAVYPSHRRLQAEDPQG